MIAPQQITAARQAPAPPKRMTLGSVVSGKLHKPKRIVLYGVEKIGKSTFAGEAPKPIFLGAEDGTSELDVARLPEPTCWRDVFDGIQTLTDDPHNYKTFVLDTLDWAEPFCWRHVCDTAPSGKKKSIEDFGYGKGYTAALDEWRLLSGALDSLRDKRQMHIIILAHAEIKSFKNPLGDDYDRYQLKVNAKASGLFREWCDCVLFANYEVLTQKKSDASSARSIGVSDGARLLFTRRTPAYDAGNRYGLPETLPLSWSEFAAACERGAPEDPTRALSRVEALLCQVDVDTRTKAEQWLKIEKNARDALALSRMADKLRGKIIINNDSEQEAKNQ